MKKLLFLSFFLYFGLHGETVDIEIPKVEFLEKAGFLVPRIEGYELDGVGEKTILPYRKLIFLTKVLKVEILEKEEIALPLPLKKGKMIYRLSDMKAPASLLLERREPPSLSNFIFNRSETFRGNRKEFSFDFYPLIPIGDKKAIKINKIRIYTEGAPLTPMDLTNLKKGGRSLLILTTEYFLLESKELENYIAVKKASGFKVDVATEQSYGGGTLRGAARVEKIREYLRGVYQNYDFLLIIADPDPGGQEVPMLIVRPEAADDPSYELVPTDIFYAELSEETDSSNNGVHGEKIDFIKFAFELVVGRIPIYDKKVEEADKILARTVDFIKESPSQADYRRRFLFPTTISYYENQDNERVPKMDGGYVAKYIDDHLIKEPFAAKTLVEKEGVDPSVFEEEEGISYAALLDRWNEGYGVIYWIGHGTPTYSIRTIWTEDKNGDGIPNSYREIQGVAFADVDMTKKISHIAPFVFQGSCLNGVIESSGSLAYSVLLNSSVGVVGSSQVSYGAIFTPYDLSSQDIFAYGALFVDAMVKNENPAQILQETKEKWSNASVLSTVKYETNYIGDPSLNLNVAVCQNDADCDDQIFCNGDEQCVDGFCEKKLGSSPCQENDDPCQENICDEATKSCKISNKTDGLSCGANKNPCIKALQCLNGECIEFGPTDCSRLDSDCAEGICDAKNGLCKIKEKNGGAPCDDNLFCTTNETCRGGICIGEPVKYPQPKPCNRTECNETYGFINVIDNSQNWNECETEEKKKGYCYYGVCVEKENQGNGGSGCSLLVF